MPWGRFFVGRIIAVGADPGTGTVDLLLRPGDPEPVQRSRLNVHRVGALAHAMYVLREVFADHSAITSLGGATVTGSDPAWTTAIEARLCEFLEDLGNCPIDSWQGARNAIANGPALAKGSTSLGLYNALAGHPAICVGSGPSATPEALRDVARLAKNHYIFAADTIVDGLTNAGCTPQFVCMLERPPEMFDVVAGRGKNSTLIAPAVIDPRIAPHFARTCWWWQGDDLFRWLSPDIPPVNSGRSAGTISLAAAILAGCNPVYLVGHDLCFASGFNGYSAAAHSLAPGTLIDNSRSLHENGGYGASRLQVPGYTGLPVWTSGMWNVFRADIEAIVFNNPDTQVFSAAANYAGAEIAWVPSLGQLPEYGPAKRVLAMPPLPPSGVGDPSTRRQSILADLAKMHEAGELALIALQDHACPLDQLAAEMAVSRIVSKENVHLFRYLVRPVNTSLELRMHMRAGEMRNPDAMQRDCLSILAKTFQALALHIGREL